MKLNRQRNRDRDTYTDRETETEQTEKTERTPRQAKPFTRGGAGALVHPQEHLTSRHLSYEFLTLASAHLDIRTTGAQVSEGKDTPHLPSRDTTQETVAGEPPPCVTPAISPCEGQNTCHSSGRLRE